MKLATQVIARGRPGKGSGSRPVYSDFYSILRISFINILRTSTPSREAKVRAGRRSFDLVVCQGVGVEGRRHSAIVDHQQLHLGDFALEALNEFEDKVDELFFLEAGEVVVPDQEREVVAGVRRFFAQDFELVRAKRHESFQELGEEHFDLGGLLDAQGYADGVDARLDQAVLLGALVDLDRVQEQLTVVLELDLRVHLSLDQGRGLPAEVEHGEQGVADRF